MSHLIALAERETPTASDLHLAAVALSETAHATLREDERALADAQQVVDIETRSSGRQLGEF